MAASAIEVVFLHCDQGMGTLIRVFDANNKLAHLVLIDLGSEVGKEKYAEHGMNSVYRSLRQMGKDGFTPTIDLLIVSHQDYDHWSLLPDLLKKIKSDFSTTKCPLVITGGTNWSDKAEAALTEWVNHFKSNYREFLLAASDYSTPGVKGVVLNVDGAAFRVLCAKVPTSSKVDLERNGTSAVMVVEFGGVTAILPGDATAQTCSWINDQIFERWENAGHAIPTRPCRALGAPHHGALRTIASNFVTTNPRLNVAKTFADYVAAKNVVASAGYESKFNHPYKEVIKILAVKAVNTPEHSIVWYLRDTDEWERKRVDRGIYTTITKFDPARRRNWSFKILSTGEIIFKLELEEGEIAPPEEPEPERYPAIPH